MRSSIEGTRRGRSTDSETSSSSDETRREFRECPPTPEKAGRSNVDAIGDSMEKLEIGAEELPTTSKASWMDSINHRLKRAGTSVMETLRPGPSTEEATSSTQKQEHREPGQPRRHWKEALWSKWNNIKYSSAWMSDRSDEYGLFNKIVLLGRFYAKQNEDQFGDPCGFEAFCEDYQSRIWMTYRTNFAPFPLTDVTTDCGWGCMLRTTQMLVAHAIFLNRLTRDWKYEKRKRSTSGEVDWSKEQQEELLILRLFEDCEGAPLGIHRLVSIAANEKGNAAVGSWYTPSEAADIMRKALLKSTSPITGDFSTFLSIDAQIHIRDVELESRNWTKKLLLVVVLRLGVAQINPIYIHHLRFLFSLSNFLGATGGKPDHSLYFIGYYGDQVIYLDPHVANEYVPLSKKATDEAEDHKMQKKLRNAIKSYHCRYLSKMNFLDMDPSCAIGFLIKSREEFDLTMQTLNLNQIIDVDLGDEGGMKRTRDPLFTVIYGDRAASNVFRTSAELAVCEFEREQASNNGFELL